MVEKKSSNHIFIKILNYLHNDAQKMKFSIKDYFRKCDDIPSFLRIWSHLLKKSLMKNFIFCEVQVIFQDFSITDRSGCCQVPLIYVVKEVTLNELQHKQIKLHNKCLPEVNSEHDINSLT